MCIDCLSIVSFYYQNSHQQMFEVSSLYMNSCLQTLSPLIDSSVNTLLQTAPNVSQSLLEFVDIVDLHLVQMLLHYSPNLVINVVEVRTIGGHSSGEMKSGVSSAGVGFCYALDVQVLCPGEGQNNCHPQHIR